MINYGIWGILNLIIIIYIKYRSWDTKQYPLKLWCIIIINCINNIDLNMGNLSTKNVKYIVYGRSVFVTNGNGECWRFIELNGDIVRLQNIWANSFRFRILEYDRISDWFLFSLYFDLEQSSTYIWSQFKWWMKLILILILDP